MSQPTNRQLDNRYPHTGAVEPARLLESEEQLWQGELSQFAPSPEEARLNLGRVPSQRRISNPDTLTDRIVRLEGMLQLVLGELVSMSECLHTHDWEEGEEDGSTE